MLLQSQIYIHLPAMQANIQLPLVFVSPETMDQTTDVSASFGENIESTIRLWMPFWHKYF